MKQNLNKPGICIMPHRKIADCHVLLEGVLERYSKDGIEISTKMLENNETLIQTNLPSDSFCLVQGTTEFPSLEENDQVEKMKNIMNLLQTNPAFEKIVNLFLNKNNN